MITIAQALKSIQPNCEFILEGNDVANLKWLSQNIQKPTVNEIENEVARLTLLEPLNACKDQAKQLIAATDWAALPDVGLKNAAEFVTYRGILRGLIITPVADPVWPTEPTPIWE